MPKRLQEITASILATKGMQIDKYTHDLRGGFEEMEKGQIFAFHAVQSSLYAVKSAKQRDSFGEKKWEVLGVDNIERVYFVRRVS